MPDETKRKFTKLNETEQAEFMELIEDSFDPDLYTEDDLPLLRASRQRWEEEQRRGDETPLPDECGEPLDEDLEPPSDWLDQRCWQRE
jgi:hypothetical protein